MVDVRRRVGPPPSSPWSRLDPVWRPQPLRAGAQPCTGPQQASKKCAPLHAMRAIVGQLPALPCGPAHLPRLRRRCRRSRQSVALALTRAGRPRMSAGAPSRALIDVEKSVSAGSSTSSRTSSRRRATCRRPPPACQLGARAFSRRALAVSRCRERHTDALPVGPLREGHFRVTGASGCMVPVGVGGWARRRPMATSECTRSL